MSKSNGDTSETYSPQSTSDDNPSLSSAQQEQSEYGSSPGSGSFQSRSARGSVPPPLSFTTHMRSLNRPQRPIIPPISPLAVTYTVKDDELKLPRPEEIIEPPANFSEERGEGNVEPRDDVLQNVNIPGGSGSGASDLTGGGVPPPKEDDPKSSGSGTSDLTEGGVPPPKKDDPKSSGSGTSDLPRRGAPPPPPPKKDDPKSSGSGTTDLPGSGDPLQKKDDPKSLGSGTTDLPGSGVLPLKKGHSKSKPRKNSMDDVRSLLTKFFKWLYGKIISFCWWRFVAPTVSGKSKINWPKLFIEESGGFCVITNMLIVALILSRFKTESVPRYVPKSDHFFVPRCAESNVTIGKLQKACCYLNETYLFTPRRINSFVEILHSSILNEGCRDGLIDKYNLATAFNGYRPVVEDHIIYNDLMRIHQYNLMEADIFVQTTKNFLKTHPSDAREVKYHESGFVYINDSLMEYCGYKEYLVDYLELFAYFCISLYALLVAIKVGIWSMLDLLYMIPSHPTSEVQSQSQSQSQSPTE